MSIMVMLSERSRPMIGKISKLLLSGSRAGGFMEAATMSPRGPFELNIQSPKGRKSCYYDVGGVGLGIVAALEKSSTPAAAIHATICCSRANRSNPVPVCDSGEKYRGGFEEEVEMGTDSLEDYTFVTCHHGPDKPSTTRVYCVKDDHVHDARRKNFDRRGIFIVSPPARCGGDDSSAFPNSDFLSSCNLCKKKLHGKDIYMYRGEKAFCSGECRQIQIMMDEGKEQCRSEATRSADVSNSIFSPGILAI